MKSQRSQENSRQSNFPVWQISLPLCTVIIFAIASLTTIYMVNGRYRFNVEITPQGLKIKTDVDKRESNPTKDKVKLDAKNNPDLG
jgi:heme-binding NEAT domain protein